MADQNKNEEHDNISSLEKTAPKKSSSRKKRENLDSAAKPIAATRTKRKVNNPPPPEETTHNNAPESNTKKSGSRRKNPDSISPSKTRIERKSKVAAKPKSDFQSSLFAEETPSAEAVETNTSIAKKKPLDAKAKLYTQVLSSIHGQELRDFSENLANIFDGALIEAIKFIESSSHETLVLISGFKEVREIITPVASNDSKNAFDHLKKSDPALIKKEIKELFAELNKRYNYTNDDLIRKDNTDIEDNEKDLILFCNIIRLSLQWCCEIILRDRYALKNNTSESESLKYTFYKTIIESIHTTLKSSPVSIQMASQLIETNCLILVKGIVDFSNDIDAISSNIQLRRDGANTVEFRISRFAQQGLSDWISNYSAITSYDNSLSQNLIGMEIMLNENNVSAFHSHDEPHETKIEISSHHAHSNVVQQTEVVIDQEVAPYHASSDVLEHQVSDQGSITPLPSPESVNDINQVTLDEIQPQKASNNTDDHIAIPTLRHSNNIYRLLTMFFIILLLMSIAYLFKIDKHKYLQSEQIQPSIASIEPAAADLTKMENTLYSSPEIGKLLVLYKSFLPTDYEILIKKFIYKGYTVPDSKVNSNVVFLTIEDIAAKRKEAISKLQLSDMDKIMNDEKSLTQKLISTEWRDCNGLLPHNDKFLINSNNLNYYLADILNVSMSELDAIQNASSYAENRLFLTDKDKTEIDNKASSLQNFEIGKADVESLIAKPPRNLRTSCKKTLGILNFIQSMPDKMRFKIEQQVLSQ